MTDAGFNISLNSSGPWRDLIRRHKAEPLHATQYFSVFGWRSEHPDVLREQSFEPYVGISVHGDRAQVLAQLDRLSAAEADNRRWGQCLADVATGSGSVQTLRLDGPFHPAQGFCWVARLPSPVPRGDQSGSLRSSVVLVEGTQALGPAHVLHADIRAHGRGRYSHWEAGLYFSTSDNTDPNTNGRRYTIVWSASSAST